jgi:Putative metallopeptidase
MKRLLTALALIFVIPIIFPTPGKAQSPAQAQAGKTFSIEYRAPRYLGMYERVKTRKVLEEFAEFMSPLRLEHDLKLQFDDDDGGSVYGLCQNPDASPNSYYDPDKYLVHICYNWLSMLENEASVRFYNDPREFVFWTARVVGGETRPPTPGLMPGFTRGEVIVGGTVSNILHEMGHAIRHNLDLPRLGREEDTADQIAGFLMLQFGKEVAMPSIKGTINVWHHLNARRKGKVTYEYEGDVHSLSLQRGLNFLCLAYGSPHSADFKQLADQWLADERKESCMSEYATVRRAFDLTIMPHVDRVKLEKVRGMRIFNPEDLQ